MWYAPLASYDKAGVCAPALVPDSQLYDLATAWAAIKPDWEVELGVVIGRSGRRPKAADAHELIAGYTIVNDISARDMNRRNSDR